MSEGIQLLCSASGTSYLAIKLLALVASSSRSLMKRLWKRAVEISAAVAIKKKNKTPCRSNEVILLNHSFSYPSFEGMKVLKTNSYLAVRKKKSSLIKRFKYPLGQLQT